MDPLDPDKIILDRLLDTDAVNDITEQISVNQVPASDQLPFVVIGQIDGATDRSLDGAGGLNEDTIAVECCAATMVQARALAKACRDSLDGQSWQFAGGWVQGAFCDNVDDDYEPRSANDEETIEIVSFQVELFIGAV